MTNPEQRDIPRLCGICRELPVGPGGQMCQDCRTRIEHTAQTNPYGWTEEG